MIFFLIILMYSVAGIIIGFRNDAKLYVFLSVMRYRFSLLYSSTCVTDHPDVCCFVNATMNGTLIQHPNGTASSGLKSVAYAAVLLVTDAFFAYFSLDGVCEIFV